MKSPLRTLLLTILASSFCLPSLAQTVVVDSNDSFLTINGIKTRQICSAGGPQSIWGLTNAHTINCFALDTPVTVKSGLVYLHVDGSASGGSLIVESVCWQEYNTWKNAAIAAGQKPPFPGVTTQCPEAHTYQIFNGSAVYVNQADTLSSSLLPAVKVVHWVAPAPVTTPTKTATSAPFPSSTPTPPASCLTFTPTVTPTPIPCVPVR